MQNYLSGLGQWVTVIHGLIFIVCVLWFRGGILGEVISQWRRFGGRRSDSPDAAKASLSQPGNRKDIAKDVAIASNSN